MAKESKRITPFTPKELTQKEKEQLQRGIYVKFAFTNHDANAQGLAGWTDDHKQAWELARMDEMSEA
jgi:hypothetical protein